MGGGGKGEACEVLLGVLSNNEVESGGGETRSVGDMSVPPVSCFVANGAAGNGGDKSHMSMTSFLPCEAVFDFVFIFGGGANAGGKAPGEIGLGHLSLCVLAILFMRGANDFRAGGSARWASEGRGDGGAVIRGDGRPSICGDDEPGFGQAVSSWPFGPDMKSPNPSSSAPALLSPTSDPTSVGLGPVTMGESEGLEGGVVGDREAEGAETPRSDVSPLKRSPPNAGFQCTSACVGAGLIGLREASDERLAFEVGPVMTIRVGAEDRGGGGRGVLARDKEDVADLVGGGSGGGRLVCRDAVIVLVRDVDGGGGFVSGDMLVSNIPHMSSSSVACTGAGAVVGTAVVAGEIIEAVAPSRKPKPTGDVIGVFRPEADLGGGASGGGSFAGGREGFAESIFSNACISRSRSSSSPTVGTSSKNEKSESLRETG